MGDVTDAGGRCPCGSGLSHAECCGPILAGDRRAATAEQLMRSRYCAFALGDTGYVLSSWHPSTRPASIDAEPDVVWRRLDVLDVVGGGPFDTTGTVEFRASWRQDAERGVLHERSRFARTGGTWLYVDGDLLPG